MRRGIEAAKRLPFEDWYIVPYAIQSDIKDRRFTVIMPRRLPGDNRIMTVIRTAFLTLHSLLILVYLRPAVVIGTGSGITVPIFLLAKMMRMKTVFIESPSRVRQLSVAGRILLGKTSLWFSSWPELARIYKGAVYAGML